MTRPIFICPVCLSALTRTERSYVCEKGHVYDISKEGYVNLLLANQKNSREPGDSKEMLDARKSFLNKGYYKPLARAVTSLIIKYRRLSFKAPSGKKLTFCQRRTSRGPITGTPAIHHDQYNSISTEKSLIAPAFHGTGKSNITEPPEVTGFDNNQKTSLNRYVFNILDAGCGEGYYTNYVFKNQYANQSSSISGIDISKEGIKSAAKRNSAINFAVAGIYALPVHDSSVDFLLNIFAPFDESGFARVLKNSGVIISVAPGASHLYELKEMLYDDVYLNDEEFKLPDKFYIAETLRIKYELNVRNREDISNLLKMTPYYHKSSPEKTRLFFETVRELKTSADFVIRVIKKN